MDCGDMQQYVKVGGGPTLGTLWIWDGQEYHPIVIGALFETVIDRGGLVNKCLAAQARDLFAQVKEIYRSLHSGGCKMLSKGDACDCFLCQIDNLNPDTY